MQTHTRKQHTPACTLHSCTMHTHPMYMHPFHRLPFANTPMIKGSAATLAVYVHITPTHSWFTLAADACTQTQRHRRAMRDTHHQKSTP